MIVCKTIFSFLLPLMVLTLSGMQNAEAQDTLKVEIVPVTTNIDVCNTEKRVTIYIQTNEIYAKDSLIGYDLDVEYDKDKFLFDQELTQGTLTSQVIAAKGIADFKPIVPGLFNAYAYIDNGSAVLKGTAPLIVFTGRYIGECEGIGSLRISNFEGVYIANPTKYLKYDDEKYIYGEVGNIQGRDLNVRFSSSVYQIGKNDSIKDIDVIIQFKTDSKITSSSIVFKTDSLKLLSIISVEKLQDAIIIDTIINYTDSVEVKVSYKQNFQVSLPALRLKLKSLKDSNFTSPISAKIIRTNVCNCVKKWSGDLVNISKIKSDSVVSVKDYKDRYNSDLHIIQNDVSSTLFSSDLINEVGIFNILGIELYRIKIEYPSFEVSLPQNSLQNGAYIVEVITNAENKRKYIKFIK